MSANAIASQLLQNGRFTNPDRLFSRQVGKEVAELWKVGIKDVNMSTQFTTEELLESLKSMKAGKAAGPDDIHPEFLLHAKDAANEWLCQYIMSTCLKDVKSPKSGARQLSSPSQPKST